MGMERISGEVAAASKHIWWLTYANKSEKRSKKNGREAISDQGVILKLLAFKHNTNRVHFSTHSKRDHHGYIHGWVF